MARVRNLSFVLLVVCSMWSLTSPTRAAGYDCYDGNGPSQNNGYWCENSNYNCSQAVADCCGEDFTGSCELASCPIILPPPYGCCGSMGITCDTPI